MRRAISSARKKPTPCMSSIKRYGLDLTKSGAATPYLFNKVLACEKDKLNSDNKYMMVGRIPPSVSRFQCSAIVCALTLPIPFTFINFVVDNKALAVSSPKWLTNKSAVAGPTCGMKPFFK